MKKERIRRLLIRDSIVVAILAVYGSIVSLTHWSIPCIVYQLTGLQCPGCGISRMLLAMLHGDFRAAFSFHPFLFATWPFIAYLILRMDHRYVNGYGMTLKKADTILACFYMIGLVIFTIRRNLSAIL